MLWPNLGAPSPNKNWRKCVGRLLECDPNWIQKLITPNCNGNQDNNPRSTMQSHSWSYIQNSQRGGIVWLNLCKALENRDTLKSRTVPASEIPPTFPLHRFVAYKEIKESSKRNECKHGFLGFKHRKKNVFWGLNWKHSKNIFPFNFLNFSGLHPILNYSSCYGSNLWATNTLRRVFWDLNLDLWSLMA